jgi:hypothetical protein
MHQVLRSARVVLLDGILHGAGVRKHSDA